MTTPSPESTTVEDAATAAAEPPPPTNEEARLRERLTSIEAAAREAVAAFSARPDTDERDHPGGLTTAQVDEAFARWDIRQSAALDALREAVSEPPR